MLHVDRNCYGYTAGATTVFPITTDSSAAATCATASVATATTTTSYRGLSRLWDVVFQNALQKGSRFKVGVQGSRR